MYMLFLPLSNFLMIPKQLFYLVNRFSISVYRVRQKTVNNQNNTKENEQNLRNHNILSVVC